MGSILLAGLDARVAWRLQEAQAARQPTKQARAVLARRRARRVVAGGAIEQVQWFEETVLANGRVAAVGGVGLVAAAADGPQVLLERQLVLLLLPHQVLLD